MGAEILKFKNHCETFFFAKLKKATPEFGALWIPYFCLNGERATLKNKTCNGAASLKKKKTEFPTDMHAQCKLSGEKGKFCFLRAFSKNVLKRQMIIFYFANCQKKLLGFNLEGKTVVPKFKKTCWITTNGSRKWISEANACRKGLV